MGQPNESGLLAAGTVFGHYQIVRHLGSGGMGSVYEAVHTELGKRVALKTLLPNYAANPEARTRFLREGKLAAKLHHPHVVDITDFGIEAGVPYLVMEFLEGEDLSALLSEQGRLFPQQIADLMLPVTAALASAHDQQIVHRDLKPQNIYLVRGKTGEWVPKVLDFGISKLLNDSDSAQLTGSMNLLGTPAYMSPEQARSAKHVDARSDQFTLCVILYQCVTGKLPFASDGMYDLMRQIVEGDFRHPRELIPGLPPEFEAVILKGMAPRPDDRFGSTWELGAALLPFASLRNQVLWEPEFKEGAATFVPKRGERAPSAPELRAITPGLNASRLAPQPSHADFAADTRQSPPTRPSLANQPTQTRSPRAQESASSDRPAEQASGSPSTAPPPAAEPGMSTWLLPVPAAEADLASNLRSRKWLGAGVGLAGLAALAVVGYVVSGPSPSRVDPLVADPVPARTSQPEGPVPVTPPVPVAPPHVEAPAPVPAVSPEAKELTPPATPNPTPAAVHHESSPAAVRNRRQAPAISSPALSGPGNLAVVVQLAGKMSWADVTLDGVGGLRSPFTKKDLPSGKHHLEISRPSFKPVQVEVEVSPGQTTKVVRELEHE